MKLALLGSAVLAALLITGCGGTKTDDKPKEEIKGSVVYKSELKVGASFPLDAFNVNLGTATFKNGTLLKATYGLGSGAYHLPSDAEDIVYIVTDRGVNIKCKNDVEVIGEDICEKGKIFPFPEFTPVIIKAKLSVDSIRIEAIITLKDSAGKNISGIANPLSNFTEIAYDIDGNEMSYDPNGLDVEALVKLSDGTYWISEEYASSLVHVAADGKVIKRLVPAGLEDDLSEATYPVEGTLPAIIASRHANRGIESIAISPDQSTLYFMMQSPLDNPSYSDTNRVRLYTMNLATSVVKEYLYEMDAPNTFNKDNETKIRQQKDVKISEMLAMPDGTLLILERISATTKLYKIDLSTATVVPSDKSADLETNDFTGMVLKTKVFDTEARGELFPNKVEGVAYLGDGKFFMINDNDFGIEGDSVVGQVINLDITKAPEVKNIPGNVVFFDTEGSFIDSIKVGVLPDMVKFTHDGTKVLVANEGEPVGNENLTIPYYDAFGTVSIIDVATKKVTTVDFKSLEEVPIGAKLRKGGEIARDVEPEYIAINEDNTAAYVSLQESNAIAKIDLTTDTLDTVFGLGFKDLSLAKNALDYKKDGLIAIEATPRGVYGMYQPDTIQTYRIGSKDYIVTANEGDDRDDFYEESTKASKLGHASIGDIGDVRVNPDLGDIDGDGEYEALYTYGTRSFSIFDGDTGALVYDSANELATTVLAQIDNSFFNTRPKKGKWYAMDERSEKKGIEPEALILAKVGAKTFAYIGLEKQGGVFVYDISDPFNVSQVEYFNDINYATTIAYDKHDDVHVAPVGIDDMAPEGSVTFTQAGKHYYANANEVSGTVSVFEIANDGRITKMGTYGTGIYYASSAEIVDYDASSKRLFVTNAAENSVMVLDISDVTDPSLYKNINLDAYGTGVNSVSVHDGLIAVAVERKE